MGFITRYGNAYSENGWRMISPDMCDREPIPGVPGLILPFRAGDASVVMRGWTSYFHRNVENLNNGGRGYSDEGSYTVVNDVGNSNHLSGTAEDLNWSMHNFRVSYSGFDNVEIAKCRAGLDLFKIDGVQTVFWGQDWSSPKDPMHFQLNLGEGNPKIAAMAKKLREGYLGIFSGTPVDPVVSPPVQQGNTDAILRYGSTGNAVAVLQKGMNAVFRSYKAMPLTVDGDFGPMTESAVKEFQLRVGIAIDGEVGPDTRRELAKFGIKP